MNRDIFRHLKQKAGRYAVPAGRPAAEFWEGFRAHAALMSPPSESAGLPAETRAPFRPLWGALAAAAALVAAVGLSFWAGRATSATPPTVFSLAEAVGDTPILIWRDDVTPALIIWMDDPSTIPTPFGG